jgi:hypothetical protein
VKIAEVLAQRGLEQHTVAILVDRRRPVQIRILVVRELAEELAAAVVERDHQLVVGFRQPVEQQAAGIVMIAVRIPHREQRRDRLHSRMAGAGEKIGGRADVGDARGAHRAVRPTLRHDPVDDLAIIVALFRRPEPLSYAERRPGAAHVHDDQCITARHEEVAVAPRADGRLRRRRSAAAQREASIVGREADNRRQGLGERPTSGVRRQIDIDRQPHPVAHRYITRAGPPGRSMGGRAPREVILRKNAPGAIVPRKIRHCLPLLPMR